MTAATLRQLWKKEYFQTVIMITAIIVVVMALWFGSQAVLGTPYPALAVASGSMCKVHPCNGWSHPFDRTLHIGDLIIVQSVKPEDIHTAPEPDGDIIVFKGGNDLVVHRAVDKIVDEQGNVQSFITKGDANSGPGPFSPTPARDVVGKVILRIPWIGHLALFMRNSSGIYIIVALMILLIVVEFVIPTLRKSDARKKPDEGFQTGQA